MVKLAGQLADTRRKMSRRILQFLESTRRIAHVKKAFALRPKLSLISTLATACVAATVLCAPTVSADNAPMWESPVGLTPGAPTTRAHAG
jgi:hypothetical protein